MEGDVRKGEEVGGRRKEREGRGRRGRMKEGGRGGGHDGEKT